MEGDMDVLFLIFDKFLAVLEYIENYLCVEEYEEKKMIELGNLYTIYETEEESKESEDDFILV